MKICIVGAGAVGAVFAARLAQMEHDISVIARGKTYQAIVKNGIGFESPDSPRCTFPVQLAENVAQLPPQELIIIAVKEPSFVEIAHQISPHLDEHTQILVAMNGLPWWFLDGLENKPPENLPKNNILANNILKSLDPQENLRELLPTANIIGGVVHFSSFSPEPGVGHLRAGNKIILGRPDHRLDGFLSQLAEAFNAAGFDAVKSENIHRDIWFKLWGNMTMNPISALCRTTTDKILDDVLVNEFVCNIMVEANEIGTKLGVQIDTSPAKRNAVTRSLGAMRTSMLQDIEHNRQLEHEALIGSVAELAAKINHPAPHINILYGLIRLLAKSSKH